MPDEALIWLGWASSFDVQQGLSWMTTTNDDHRHTVKGL